jgi:hypothetical protein
MLLIVAGSDTGSYDADPQSETAIRNAAELSGVGSRI